MHLYVLDSSVAKFTSRPTTHVSLALKSGKRLKYSPLGQKQNNREPKIISIQPGAGEEWKAASVVEMLQNGAVGIIPTDTLPAIVADLQNRDAVLRLYAVKEMSSKKPLSILCRNFQDISYYTAGFPVSNEPGSRNWFNILRRVLPGPFTLILPASKNLPSQMVDFMKGKTIHRKSVGVRLPDDDVCQAVLQGMDRPLLCTSVHVDEHLDDTTEVPDVGNMLQSYGGKGIDFIIDVGPRIATVSTVVDMTTPTPEIVRVGRGDPSIFEI
ncbi:hypothetical protein CEUSTIGMA_g1424.t1 [Chlamydomonas eustigma]|uniref:Threonylcarbamoyl-AMP synthase n=1 Tax=Chlamydomonas eustigma TaxID=1157962 RepID=A0A250WT10_9CHLO|nr:hypothetical protein CEUSTIGMA_g1424.t1 [Chlamydomonas eustigma]|eukprot:GAX73974.1 hypothetical protein CEUSTIGMA_g1424.t1 [Chlamydomonas eustigma]